MNPFYVVTVYVFSNFALMLETDVHPKHFKLDFNKIGSVDLLGTIQNVNGIPGLSFSASLSTI